MRGGSWGNDSDWLAASYRNDNSPTVEMSILGFRVASVPVPEPTAFIPAMLICVGVFMRRKR